MRTSAISGSTSVAWISSRAPSAKSGSGPSGDRGGGDDDHAVDAEVQHRLDRRVEPGSAVVVPAAEARRLLDAHAREQRRDGGRCAGMVDLQPRRHVVDGERSWEALRGPALDEHDAPLGRDRGGHDADRLDGPVAHVAVQSLPVDPLGQRLLQRRRVEQPAQPRARHAQHLARVEQRGLRRLLQQDRADDSIHLQRLPALDADGQRLLGRQMRVGRGERRVERADARPQDHRRPLPARFERGQKSGQNARLVSAARATAGQDQPDAF